jgi:hypothetical protein
MKVVKLIYFEGCPKLNQVRDLLRSIPGVHIEEVRQDDLPEGARFLGYSSPSVLLEGRIIYGTEINDAQGGCSIGDPDIREIQRLLSPQSKKVTWLTSVASFLPVFAGWFCPACLPPLAGFLSAIGVGIFAQEKVMTAIFFAGISLTLFGLSWSYFKVHRNICPLVAGVLMSSVLIAGRLLDLQATVDSVFLYGGGLGLMLVSLWNLRVKRPCGCTLRQWNCSSCFFPKET